ncbi:hypothetical protein PHMEG_00021877 [Phytophthora megakarya]|uniref:RxLR effector protein n=1 Tax=Phytophthora megakarya TaxID=4795 RepID=A0A225VK39_9STRA|nr:hypothetical protein PHMEG_00021877 [Phytophthora megakarya]
MRLLLWFLLAFLITLCSSVNAAPITRNLTNTSQTSPLGLIKLTVNGTHHLRDGIDDEATHEERSTVNGIRHLRDGIDDEATHEEREITSSIVEAIRRIAKAISNKLYDLVGKFLNNYYFKLYQDGVTPDQLKAVISTERNPKKYDIVKDGYARWYKMKKKLDEANGNL